jgi:hypothetical protein
MNPVCPKSPPASAGEGLVPIDRCAFPLVDKGTWQSAAGVISALDERLEVASIADVLDDLNRTAVPVASVPGSPPSFVSGFRWDDEDNSKPWWIPQGITGSADASATGTVAGREVVLVSFYYDLAKHPGSTGEKGVRVAFVDTTLSPPKYRLALLVEPVAGDPPSFKAVPIHAGGIAWVGDYLYVADTSKGLRVFDVAHIFKAKAAKDAIGYDAADDTYYGGLYAYVIPQIGAYTHASMCGPRFSFVALDRSTSPISLVSGEYCNATDACGGALEGRLYRWPLDPASSRLAAPTTYPSEAFYAGQSHIQGGVSSDGTFYLSSSAPAGSAGDLYVVPPGEAASTYGWINSPEDLMFDTGKNRIWGLSEGEGARYVFAVGAVGYK